MTSLQEDLLIINVCFESHLTCAGADPHYSIKAHLFLHISPQVIEETLLVSWGLNQSP